MRRHLGLDEPVPVQFASYLARAVRLAGLGAEGPDAPEPAVSRRKGHLAVIADL
mgnify:CR=1 FL=1